MMCASKSLDFHVMLIINKHLATIVTHKLDKIHEHALVLEKDVLIFFNLGGGLLNVFLLTIC